MNIGVLAVIIGATVLAVVFPPAGAALFMGLATLGAVYGSSELGSAITGKDLISGRELGTGERWFRGVLAPLDIIPGAAAVKRFSGVAKVTSFAGDLGKLGKTKAQSSIRKVNDLSIAAGREAASRLKNVGAVMKERALAAPTKLAEGAIGAGKVVDETFTNAKIIYSNLTTGPELAFVGGAAKQTATNTHVVENTMRDVLSKIDGVNIGGRNGSGGANKLIDYGEYSTNIDLKVTEVSKVELGPDLASTFTDGNYRTVVTDEKVTLYRSFGGKADAGGGFATTNATKSRIDAKIDTALLPEWGNTRMYEALIEIPKGETLNVGKVAAQTIKETGTILQGGADQILLPRGWQLEWIKDVRYVPSK